MHMLPSGNRLLFSLHVKDEKHFKVIHTCPLRSKTVHSTVQTFQVNPHGREGKWLLAVVSTVCRCCFVKVCEALRVYC